MLVHPTPGLAGTTPQTQNSHHGDERGAPALTSKITNNSPSYLEDVNVGLDQAEAALTGQMQ